MNAWEIKPVALRLLHLVDMRCINTNSDRRSRLSLVFCPDLTLCLQIITPVL